MNLIRSLGNFFIFSFRHPKIQRAAWIALALWTADVLVLAFFWLPAALQYHQLESRIGGYRKAEQEAREAVAEAARYGQLESQTRALETKWGIPITQSGLIESLGTLASHLGLKIISQNFDPPVSGGPRAFRQTITLMGSYSSLRRFLAGLEDLPTLTVVQQVQMERVGEDAAQIRATLRFSTFLKSPGRENKP
jgi:Tfp pilus assembly protein PilO